MPGRLGDGPGADASTTGEFEPPGGVNPSTGEFSLPAERLVVGGTGPPLSDMTEAPLRSDPSLLTEPSAEAQTAPLGHV
jgi:hypothetical protein